VSLFRAAVIDTSALFSALVAQYDLFGGRSQKRSVRPVASLKPPLNNELVRREYLELLGSIRTKFVTSHVVAELYGLRRELNLDEDGRVNFWRSSLRLLQTWNIEEAFVQLFELYDGTGLEDCIARLGPTDTSLVALAGRKGCPLITEDEELTREAWRLGVETHLVKNLFAEDK
jgi:rRNA-processing protein FCF1